MLPLLSSTIYLVIRSLNGVDARPVNTTITSLPISDVFCSIVADSVNATASSQRCSDINNCRTLNDIITSCLVTILACAWFAVHHNIPAPKLEPPPQPNHFIRCVMGIWGAVLYHKGSLVVFLVAFIAPEWVLAWALRQALVAKALAGKLEKARLKAIEARKKQKDAAETFGHVEGHLSSTPTRTARSNSSTGDHTCEKCDGLGSPCYLVATVSQRVAKGGECWTWSHGFFTAMGGFYFYNKDGPVHPLSPEHVLELVARGHLVPPTADELSDKSKGDWLSKGVAIVQTAWFVVQCIVRSIQGLPMSRLEVMTLAYTVITVAMYTAWWAKPLNVSCADRVPEEELEDEVVLKYNSNLERIGSYLMGAHDGYVDLRKCKRVPTFWAGKANFRDADNDFRDADNANLIALWVAMAFGAVHCIAWHSEFLSPLTQQLWRMSAIAIVSVAPALVVGNIIAEIIGDAFDSEVVLKFLLGVLYTFIAIVYTAARIVLTILSFTSLRVLPFGAYQTVQWATFIPHI